jgi:pimeloyl-ACP methyl ester carboxylesterase
VELAWEAHGTGRPVLCLHGFGLDRTVMAAALEPVLAQRPGWRRIYPDLPGHGESPAGPGDSDGVAASVHEWADLLLGGYAGPFRALAAFPAASYTVLAGAGHYLPLEQPAAFRALTLAWLDAAFADGPGPAPISGC